MKLLAKIKVIMLLIVLIVTGACSYRNNNIPVVQSRDCFIPARVELKALDNESHIGSEKNIAIIMVNIADLVAYIKNLEASIKCFSSPDVIQSEAKNPSL